jgi:hypothetical protein
VAINVWPPTGAERYANLSSLLQVRAPGAIITKIAGRPQERLYIESRCELLGFRLALFTPPYHVTTLLRLKAAKGILH